MCFENAKLILFLRNQLNNVKNWLYLLLVIFLTSCTSVSKHNARLEQPISPELLKKDIDYTNQKLQKLHPNLYWYISKKDLDKKFDSLKTTIKKPLKPNEFYEKLAPIITDVREGHLRLVPPSKRLTKKEVKKLQLQKGLLSRMDYLVQDNRLYVKENKDNFSNIKIGTEILEIDQESTKNLLNKYKNYISGDGYNTTFAKYGLAETWATFFTIEKGILDSVKIKTQFNNEVKDFYIRREKKSEEQVKEENNEKKELYKIQENKINDFNFSTKDHNRKLQFIDKDSRVAYMKIATFSGKYSRQFYEESFKKIVEKKSEFLILDVRDNLGGSLSEIHNLYSYLAKEEFKFLKDIEVTNSNSMLEADYLRAMPKIVKPLGIVTYPIYFIGSKIAVRKKQSKFFLRNNSLLAKRNPKSNAFKGKIYVLVNGSSFSASSIISSKLKNDLRAIIVGEETGGANDGTVAGRYSTTKLPNSKLRLPIGLMLIQPNIEFTNTKKGVTPDIEIIPNLQDRLNKKDVQLEWIKQDIFQEKAKN